MSDGQLEQDIRALLEKTREENRMYASAAYRDDRSRGNGLAARLEAIEEALLQLAHAVDENR